MTICVLGEWVVSTWGLLSVCSAFNGLISENEMAASKTEALWFPAGLLQEQGPGACGPPDLFFSVVPSNYLFSMTSEACKQFSGSTAVWMTLTGGRSQDSKQQALWKRMSRFHQNKRKDDDKDIKNDTVSLFNIDFIVLNSDRFLKLNKIYFKWFKWVKKIWIKPSFSN